MPRLTRAWSGASAVLDEQGSPCSRVVDHVGCRSSRLPATVGARHSDPAAKARATSQIRQTSNLRGPGQTPNFCLWPLSAKRRARLIGAPAAFYWKHEPSESANKIAGRSSQEAPTVHNRQLQTASLGGRRPRKAAKPHGTARKKSYNAMNRNRPSRHIQNPAPLGKRIRGGFDPVQIDPTPNHPKSNTKP